MADWTKMNNKGKAAAMDWYGIPHNFKPRDVKPRVDHPDLESKVIREVGELLAVHPLVAIALRQNSGGASYEAASGRYAPLKFYEILTHRKGEITICDFWGLLKDGRPFTLEAKERTWKERPQIHEPLPEGWIVGETEARERRQLAFITLVRNIGGIGAFVRSSEEANEVLNG